jgi:hypothetical protein
MDGSMQEARPVAAAGWQVTWMTWTPKTVSIEVMSGACRPAVKT